MSDSINLYYHTASTASFTLDSASVSITNLRGIESFEIPGKFWNLWYDNFNITRRWTISGKFFASDCDWGQGTGGLYRGRPLDFVHELTCYLNVRDPITGSTPSLPPANLGFDVEIVQNFNGTERTYRSNRFTSQEVILLFERLDTSIEGGTPSVVSYTMTFVEVEQIIPMGSL